MISVEEALERILGYASVLEPEEKPILEALGQVLAEDVFASFNIPPLDNSAMDGYALRGEDTFGASAYDPIPFEVVGEARPGVPFEGVVERAQAARVMTGAKIPDGADAVVMAEVCLERDGRVEVTEILHAFERGADGVMVAG